MSATSATSMVVVRALGLVTVQDLGRAGRMHEAVPAGGALVRDRLIAANRAVHNPDDAPAIEVLGRLVIRAERALQVATDTAAARLLQVGDELSVASEPRRDAGCERRPEDAREVERKRCARVAHGGREQFGERRPERTVGQAHEEKADG